MSFEFWYTLVLLVIMSYLLMKDWFDTALIVFGTLILLLIGKVITIDEAFSGFSNVGMLTIGILFIIAGAIYNTGAISQVHNIIFGNSHNTVRRMFRILFPVSLISAFMNNTPVVAMLTPVVRSWTEKQNLSLSKFLIPLSYAAILGGMCTLIGTSTNLVVHGLLIDHGLPGLGLFEISKVGIPLAIIGLLYIITIGYKLLPDRQEPLVRLGKDTREFVIELKVKENYPHIGATIENAGLRHLTGLFLFQIERGGRIIAPAGPNEKILEGDRLFFTGIPKTILELQKTPGLQLIKDQSFDLKQYDSSEIKTYEAAISPSSPLIGNNVRESNFREKYGAVIIAIHRNGERINKKIGDIVLFPGDTLLLLADKNFRKKWYHSNDFYLISDTEAIPSKPKWQMFISVGVLLLIVLLTLFKIMPLISAAALGALILIISRCITPQEASRSIDFKVLIIIASALGIANAMENSGLAEFISSNILTMASNFGAIGVITGIYIVTSLYTLIITNNAAAAFLFPVGFMAAVSLGVDVKPFAITIMIAAAASFATPISYQTNLMVYGPGGYKFRDFIKVGLPLQIVVGVCAILLIYYFYF